MKITFGKKYKDKLHGLEGYAIAQTDYMTGCSQVQLEYMDKDGDIRAVWFDITQLEKVKVSPSQRKPGGPRSHAPARAHG